MLNKTQIEAIIPHRNLFSLLDEIHDLIPAHSAKGITHVGHNEFWMSGHFPGQPVMPGVLIIEALAQVGAVVMLAAPEYVGKIAYFTGIEKAKFRKKVIPGDTLEIAMIITKIRGSFGYGEGTVTVNGDVVCEATCSFAIG